jgi:hypothetical protein
MKEQDICQEMPVFMEGTQKVVPQRRTFSPFISGRSFEYRVMKALKKHGYYCFRSHASQGPFDIAAIAPVSSLDKRPLLIQAKKHAYIHPRELSRLLDSGRLLAARVIFVSKDKEGQLVFREYPCEGDAQH